MVIYISLYLLLFMVSFIKILTRSNKNWAYLYFSFIFLLLALRAPNLGVDLGDGITYGYLHSFDVIKNMTWADTFNASFLNYEKGYVVFNKLISDLFCDNHQVLLVCCAFLSVYPIAKFVKEYSKLPVLSAIIYLGLPCFVLCFSGLRQAVAIGMCSYSIIYIEKHELNKFILLVFFASLFHSSAILFSIAYVIYHIKLKKKYYWYSLILIPILYLFRYQIFTFLTRLLRPDASIDNNNSVTLFLVFVFIYVFLIFFSNKGINWGLLNLFFVACVIQALAGVNSLILRVGYYYMIPLIVLLPNLIFESLKRDLSFFVISCAGVTICFALFGLYTLIYSSLIGGGTTSSLCNFQNTKRINVKHLFLQKGHCV